MTGHMLRHSGALGFNPVNPGTPKMVTTLNAAGYYTAEINKTFHMKLSPATEAAEDSFNFVPAMLGERSSQPLRPNMVLHSADGVFAVRQGPWKWIEGNAAKPDVQGRRAKECHPQLYNLADNSKEKPDAIREHSEVPEQLAKELGVWRKQGHTRN